MAIINVHRKLGAVQHLGSVVFEICQRKDRQTYLSHYFAPLPRVK